MSRASLSRLKVRLSYLKGFHFKIFLTRNKTFSNKTQGLTKSMNMDLWVINTLNQPFLRGSYIFQKTKVVIGKTLFFVIGPFCTPSYICLNIGFWLGTFLWKCCAFNCSTFNWKMVLYSFKKVFVWNKICFNIKVLKTFKIFIDC